MSAVGAYAEATAVTAEVKEIVSGKKAECEATVEQCIANIKQFQEGNVGDEPGGPLHSLRITECNHCS